MARLQPVMAFLPFNAFGLVYSYSKSENEKS